MREFGIVVFFCEYNRQTDSFGNYGFISPYTPLQGAKRDIYVRKKDADPKIMRNDIVTFEKTESSKGYSAKDVKKLIDDKEVLHQLISYDNEKGYYKLIKFIKGYSYVAFTKFQNEVLSGLTGDVIENSLWIWPSLDEAQLRQAVKDRYTGTDKEFWEIFKKDKAFFEDRDEMVWFNSYYIDYIPVDVKRNIALASEDALWAWPSLDEDQLKEVVKNRFIGVDKAPEDTYRKDKRYFENAGKMTWFCNNYFNNIPDEIIKKTLVIMDDLPDSKKKELIKNHQTQGVYDYWNWDKRQFMRWPELFILTPDNIEHIDSELYYKFNNETKMKYLRFKYDAEEDKNNIQIKIVSLLKESTRDGIYYHSIENEVPDEMIPDEEILKNITLDRKRNALLNSAYKFTDTEKEAILASILNGLHFWLYRDTEMVNELFLADGVLTVGFVKSYWDILIVKFPSAVINFLIRNVKLLSETNCIDDNMKILLLYLMARSKSRDEDILEITKPENNNNKVAVVRLFYESSQSMKQGRRDEAEEFFIKAHGALLSLMQLQDGKIADTKYLFPECTNSYCKCRYCEAKFWIPSMDNENRKEYAYCPRTRGKFDLDNDCAHIQAQTHLSVASWSLLEFLEVLGLTGFKIRSSQHLTRTGYVNLSQIDPREHLSRLRDSREYIPRMAGGFNRLYELGGHIKCRGCKANMIFDLKYSIKDFAVYMLTFASCGNENSGHDHNVYLSHCHGCDKIIDSRDDRFRDGEGFYICMNCGTGGYNTTPGRICPNCGHSGPNMVPLEYGRYHCNHCGHEIRVPNKYKHNQFRV